MSHDEHPADTALTQELRDSLAELAVPERPPLAAIIGRGRVHRRRRLACSAGLGGAGAAAGIALALGLTGVFGAAPARGTGTIQTAAFTLTSNANGTASLNLSQMFDPPALQRALAHDGIPALVRSDTYCSSRPAVPAPVSLGVFQVPGGTRHRAPPARGGHGFTGIMQSAMFPVSPSDLAPSVDPVTMVINPAAMPPGTELFIGYFNLGYTVYANLIYTSSHTCSNSQEPPTP
jgi:hypothetical protein